MTEKEFNKLSKFQQRQYIAMDVLDSIVSRVFNVNTGSYIMIHDPDNRYESIKENPKVPCHVCAMGGLLISTCRITNDLTYSEANSNLWELKSGRYKKFDKIFGPEHLFIIENYFEGKRTMVSQGVPYTRKHKLYMKHSSYIHSYVTAYPDSKDRLVAIMYNIIANNGTFDPKKEIDSWKA